MEKGIAIIISVVLIAAVVGVEYFYGWGKVKEDVVDIGENYLDKLSKSAGVFWEGAKGYFMPESVEEKVTENKTSDIEEITEKIANKTGIDLIEKIGKRIGNMTTAIKKVDVEKYKAEIGNLTGRTIGLVEVSLEAFRTVIIPLPVEFINALSESGIIQDFVKMISETFSTLSYVVQQFIPMAQDILNEIAIGIGNIITSLQNLNIDVTPVMGTPKSYFDTSKWTTAGAI